MNASDSYIARLLVTGFGVVACVAVAMCVVLVYLLGKVSGSVTQMRQDEEAIRESLQLAAAIREQYIHQAHWIITRDDSHLVHYEVWLEHIRIGIENLRPLVSPKERAQIAEIADASEDLDRLFRESIMPAALQQDHGSVAALHEQAESHSLISTQLADQVTHRVEQSMARFHDSATAETRLGLQAGGLFILLIVSLSIWFTIQLKKAVLKPLDILKHAAHAFGAAQFEHRIGAAGKGELNAVAVALDRMADELEARERLLINSERMAAIGQLAAGVAHEINNPIQVIRGYLRTMGDSPKDELREELAILDEEARSCQRIAEDLVTYARTPKLHYGAIDMEVIVHSLVERLKETSPDLEHELVVEVESRVITVDSNRIRQVVTNLLVNAIQMSPPKSTLTIIGRSGDGDRYRVSVLDQGPGVKPEEASKIFEPFFSKRQGGSGLGLAICQGIVNAHGGNIWVENRPHGGAEFSFTIDSVRKEEPER